MILDRTEAASGVPINPHLFRDCAGTTFANEDPEHILAVTAILGHASIQTTSRHYIQANSIAATRH